MLTPTEALQAYARMLNTLDHRHLEPLLAEDFHYASQAVFHEMTSKAEYLAYITLKLETIRTAGAAVFAEMGRVRSFQGEEPCVIVAQGDRNDLVALVLARVDGTRITRLDMCSVAPHPTTATRSGVYPGR